MSLNIWITGLWINIFFLNNWTSGSQLVLRQDSVHRTFSCTKI